MIVPDHEAMLVALVLAPATYSRNRFFEMYRDPAVQKVRRRASLLRGIVRHLARVSAAEPGELLCVTPAAGGRVELSYAVRTIGLRRTALLEPIELALVRFSVSRVPGAAQLAPEEADRARIEAALGRLAPVMPAPATMAASAPPSVPPPA